MRRRGALCLPCRASSRCCCSRAQQPPTLILRLQPLNPLLRTCQVLADLRRLLPQQDPVKALLANPGLVLDMDSAGQASSIEKEGELIDEAMLRGS